jgi:hypothetical protein
MNRKHLAETQRDPNIEALIESFELAFRMQSEAPDLMKWMRNHRPPKRSMASARKTRTISGDPVCWHAGSRSGRPIYPGLHRLQVGPAQGSPGWPQRHRPRHRPSDRRLLQDLKGRGLLDDTLVVWGAEFGRTPFAENENVAIIIRKGSPSGWPAAASAVD